MYPVYGVSLNGRASNTCVPKDGEILPPKSGVWAASWWGNDGKNFFHLKLSEEMDVSKKIVVPQNGWFILEKPIKMDDLGVPPFSETSK